MTRDLHQTNELREEDTPEPPQLRRFRRLVSGMMITMIVAIVVVAAALVWRLAREDAGSPLPPAAAEIAVPEGYSVLSVSRAGPRLYLLMQNEETDARQIEERSAETMQVIGTYRLIPKVE